MATISLKSNKMAQKAFDVLNVITTESLEEQNKYKSQVFLIEYRTYGQTQLNIGQKVDAEAIRDTYASILISVEDDNGKKWLKRPQPFGLERRVYWEMDNYDTGYQVYFKNIMKQRTISMDIGGGNTLQIIINPILIHQDPLKELDHIGFFRVLEENNEMVYELIMSLQITPLGTQNSTYGNLYHLKHLTFTFS